MQMQRYFLSYIGTEPLKNYMSKVFSQPGMLTLEDINGTMYIRHVLFEKDVGVIKGYSNVSRNTIFALIKYVQKQVGVISFYIRMYRLNNSPFYEVLINSLVRHVYKLDFKTCALLLTLTI